MCTGFNRKIGANVACLTPDENFKFIVGGSVVLELDRRSMFEVRSAIDDGLRWIRRGERT
jgi:hypothetical protein